MFLVTLGKAGAFAVLQDPDWVLDLAFRVDVTAHLNDLRGRTCLCTSCIHACKFSQGKSELYTEFKQLSSED